MSCLKVNAKVLNNSVVIRANIVCGIGGGNIALMVNEGYLFVDGKNGELLYLFIEKTNGRLSSK